MLNSLPVALVVGTLLGFLSGLGIGGGSLLILWLTLVLQVEPLTARGINLLFFLPAAVVSLFMRRKQQRLPWKQLLPAMAAGCISAAALTLLTANLDMRILKKLFGGLLLITGLRELTWKAPS